MKHLENERFVNYVVTLSVINSILQKFFDISSLKEMKIILIDKKSIYHYSIKKATFHSSDNKNCIITNENQLFKIQQKKFAEF